MATLRTLAIIGVTAFAGLAFSTSLTHAQSAAGAPLKLTPLAYSGHTVHRSTRKHRQVQRPATLRTRTAARKPDENVIQVPSGVSLTSLLPWWRADELQVIRYRERADESQVLSAAEAWFAALGVEKTVAAENDFALASSDEINEIDLAANGMTIANADEVNAIDLAADGGPPDNPEHKSWLSVVLASLGGALAVASTARFLFV